MRNHFENSRSTRNLKSLSDQELDQSLKSLVKKENEVLAEILLHVKEVASRRLYLKMNCASLFEYLTKNMGYANGPAQRRIDAARLSKEVPTLIEDLKNGELNLSQVSLFQQGVRKRRREQQKFEKAGLHAEAETKAELSAEVKMTLLEKLKQKSISESQVLVSKTFEVEVQVEPKITYQADESVRLEVTLTKEQWEKLERMRSLVSHALPDGSWDQVLEYVADRVIASKTKVRAKSDASQPGKDQEPKSKSKTKSKLKSKTQLTSKSITTTSSSLEEDLNSPSSSSESQDLSRDRDLEIQTRVKKDESKAVKLKSYYQLRKDLLREHHSCQHVDASTKAKCTSTWKLQVEHIKPRWAGGEDAPENLTILCAQHNRQKYREQAGIRML